MVLLLGCDTAVSKAEPETFIARLRDVGAAVVVGTVSPVLGENAAPGGRGAAGRAARTVRGSALSGGAVATFGESAVRVADRRRRPISRRAT